VLLLRYSGLRIGDVVSLPRERIADGKLFLYTAKTGTPVWCPLCDAVIQALDAVRGTSEKYFFWTGQGKLKSAVGDWQRSLKDLLSLAEGSGGHPHRFRHTFAVERLLAGVPIERVSVLLGHSSTRITEKQYSAWVRARQEQLEADVRASWALESGMLSTEPNTYRARGKMGLVTECERITTTAFMTLSLSRSETASPPLCRPGKYLSQDCLGSRSPEGPLQ
jgi:hypothetical protein